MRLMRRGRETVLCRDRLMAAAVRPLSGGLAARAYGEGVQDMLRLLLPFGAQIAPGDRVTAGGKPYVCVAVRRCPGHTQADIRRCAK